MPLVQLVTVRGRSWRAGTTSGRIPQDHNNNNKPERPQSVWPAELTLICIRGARSVYYLYLIEDILQPPKAGLLEEVHHAESCANDAAALLPTQAYSVKKNAHW